MPRVLLFAATTGYQVRVFGEAAERLGVEVVLATDRCHVLHDPWGDRAIPVRFDEPGAGLDGLVELLAGGPVDGVLGLGDRPAYVAALAAERLGLRFHPAAAMGAAQDKYVARQRFAAAGLRVPRFVRVPLEADPAAVDVRYPVVLKPLGLSASRGVIRANDSAEFAVAFARIRQILREPDILRRHEDQDRFLQVEEYIDGQEFAVEGVMTAGRLHVFAIFDKPDPLTGPYFEETIYVTPSRAAGAVQAELVAAAGLAAEALGLRDGPVHAELRYNEHGAWPLEVAGRPIGGLCARALRFGDDEPFEEMLLRHAVGEDVRGRRLATPAAGVMMIPIPRAGIYQEAAGVDEARVVPGITDVVITATVGQRLLPLPEGQSYLGFLFAAGETAAGVEGALREAHGRLRFTLQTVLY